MDMFLVKTLGATLASIVLMFAWAVLSSTQIAMALGAISMAIITAAALKYLIKG